MTAKPSPTKSADELARDQLVRELRALETPELLALCLRGRNRLDRLRLYLSLLRGRAGARAQLASCLVCFDLARQGDDVAQKEFFALAPTIEELARDGKMVSDLVAHDAYLERTWNECLTALENSDQRELDAPLSIDESAPIGELDLLSDVELELDLELEVLPQAEDPIHVERAKFEFANILARQLGQDSEHGIFGGTGFETGSSRELDRLQGFLDQAISYSDMVTTARGMASLGHLFLATSLRMKSLFGKRNPRRAQALRTGLLRLPADVTSIEHAAAIFELEGGNAMVAFEKVVELVLDYLAYCHQQRKDPRAAVTVDSYVESERTPQPVLLTGESRRRRG
ncbi:MAG: hypothetical protein JST54_18790 [Deltaproteobacteria bacterium]|nr:hypothetical protein [Deltaproteobacteria bacterium]